MHPLFSITYCVTFYPSVKSKFFGVSISALTLCFCFRVIMVNFQAIANHKGEPEKREAANLTNLAFLI